MVNRATIEKQFDESVQDAQGGPSRPDQRESVSCTYVTESLVESDVKNMDKALSLSVKVELASDKVTTAEEALDAYMVDGDDETVDYERADGLGNAAGYASSDLEVRLGGNHLVAILEIDGTFVEVITKSEPEGTMDKLKPIADELVEGVESKLR